MTDLNRRSFLQLAGGTAAVAALTSSIERPPLSPLVGSWATSTMSSTSSY